MTPKDSTAMGLQRDTGHRYSRLYRYFSSLWEAASSAAAPASWAALVTCKSANGAGPSCKRGCESYRHQLDNCICTDEDAKIQADCKAHCDSHRLVIKLKTTRGDKQSERSVSTVRRSCCQKRFPVVCVELKLAFTSALSCSRSQYGRLVGKVFVILLCWPVWLQIDVVGLGAASYYVILEGQKVHTLCLKKRPNFETV